MGIAALFLGIVVSASNLSAKPERLTIAVVQLAERPTLAANRDHMVSWVGKAADAKARVVVFPEGALVIPAGTTDAEKKTAIDALREAARQRKIYVVTGMNSFSGSPPKGVNSMFVLGPGGEDVFSYTKLYNVNTAPMPGIFSIDGIPCSGMICADRWLRGVEEIPLQEGAQISFEVSNNFAIEWVAPFQWYWNVPRALRNNAWVVVSNSANPPGTAPGTGKNHGHGAIIAPDGRLAAVSRDENETMTVMEIDVSAATLAEAQARATHPVLRVFWEAGVKLQRGEKVPAPALAPLRSPEVAVTLAASQVTGDLAAMQRAIADARRQGADLVAFPAGAAREADVPALQAAAREAHLTVVVGARHSAGAVHFNSAFVLGPDGALLTRYDQMSARAPLMRGTNPAAMWFTVKGVPAIVTLERDALWTEIAELAAVAGARIIVHLDHDLDASADARLRRQQVWVNHASFQTFTVTVNPIDATIWDDLRGIEETSAQMKGRPRPDSGAVEIFSPWSANLVTRASTESPLIVATRKIQGPVNLHHPNHTSRFNPQMEPWYRIGAALIHPQ